ncbi:hypothetical protein G1C97_1888 [Bifidobacterium sp. DSM 109959]|uniref:Uncharacterized protein n=1 Tax=Bifidobacterium olomucense TaxID=2675324 RepID=A0A7Y0EYV4_9BIFI|nr:hypothetical protein [Bifidobacterium sp. DSM 109959]
MSRVARDHSRTIGVRELLNQIASRYGLDAICWDSGVAHVHESRYLSKIVICARHHKSLSGSAMQERAKFQRL